MVARSIPHLWCGRVGSRWVKHILARMRSNECASLDRLCMHIVICVVQCHTLRACTIHRQFKCHACLAIYMQYGMTPLMWAAMEGNEYMAKLLINYRAKIDAMTQVSIDPLSNPNPMPNAKY